MPDSIPITDEIEETRGDDLVEERDLAHRRADELRFIVEDQAAHLAVLLTRIEAFGSEEEELRAMVALQLDEQKRIIASRDEGISWLRGELALAREGIGSTRHGFALEQELTEKLTAAKDALKAKKETIDLLRQKLKLAKARLEQVQSSRAYRLATKIKRVMDKLQALWKQLAGRT